MVLGEVEADVIARLRRKRLVFFQGASERDAVGRELLQLDQRRVRLPRARMWIEGRAAQEQAGVREAILGGGVSRAHENVADRLAARRVRLARGLAQRFGPILRVGPPQRLELPPGDGQRLAQHLRACLAELADLLGRELDALERVRDGVRACLLLGFRQRLGQKWSGAGQGSQRFHRRLCARPIAFARDLRQLLGRSGSAEQPDGPERQLGILRSREPYQVLGQRIGAAHDGERVAGGARDEQVGILEQIDQRADGLGRRLLPQGEAQRSDRLHAHRGRMLLSQIFLQRRRSPRQLQVAEDLQRSAQRRLVVRTIAPLPRHLAQQRFDFGSHRLALRQRRGARAVPHRERYSIDHLERLAAQPLEHHGERATHRRQELGESGAYLGRSTGSAVAERRQHLFAQGGDGFGSGLAQLLALERLEERRQRVACSELSQRLDGRLGESGERIARHLRQRRNSGRRANAQLAQHHRSRDAPEGRLVLEQREDARQQVHAAAHCTLLPPRELQCRQMRLLQHRIAGPEPCPYLPGLSSTTETMLMTGVSPVELERLLERGWRRFGPVYFRPVCGACSECISVRVPVEAFKPSPNLKRVQRRGSKLRVEVTAPQVDDERLALYRRWHASREEERGWKPDRIGAESYAMQFCFPHPAAREFSYWDGEELVGVGIADETPLSLSAVYCYHDPEREKLSIGTYNVLQ